MFSFFKTVLITDQFQSMRREKQKKISGKKDKNILKKYLQSLFLEIDQAQSLQSRQKANLKVSLADDVQAIYKAFKVSREKDKDRNNITCSIDLNLRPINEALKKFAEENDYKGITVQRKKTLRGGKSTIYTVELEDEKEKIVQKILEVKGKKEQIQKYISGVLLTNETTQMLTDTQIRDLSKYQRDIATLTKDMIVYEEINSIKQEKNVNQSRKIPIDLVFVIDATGSMSKLYEAAKQKCKHILQELKFEDNKAIDLKFAFIAYRDHLKTITEQNKSADNPIHKVVDFDTFENIYNQIASIECTGGDDTAEAIHDGLMRAASLTWRRDSHRYVYLIADAPPHGSEYHQNKCSDNYPKHCPCNIKLEDIVNKYQQMKINFVFSTVKGGNTYDTDSVFKANFPENGYSSNQIIRQSFGSLISQQIQVKYDKYKQILTKFNKLVKQIEIKRIEKAVDIAITLCQEQAALERQIRLTQVYDDFRAQLAKSSKDLLDLKAKLLNQLKEARTAEQPILGKAAQLNKKIFQMAEHKKKNQTLASILECYFESFQKSSQDSESTQFEDF